MADIAAAAPAPWYRALNATQWKTLAAANLGWLFDGFETYALILTAGVRRCVHLLEPAHVSANSRLYQGAVGGDYFARLGHRRG